MSVTATAPVSSAANPLASASPPAAPAANALNYNDFLSLLLAEMKNQDPTQPMKASDMVSQLATVSEVGQSVQTNTTLASMLTSTSLSQAEQLIGKTLTAADGSSSGLVSSVSVNSSGVTANLADGSQIPLVDGVMISS